jgi:hypothetical protein
MNKSWGGRSTASMLLTGLLAVSALAGAVGSGLKTGDHMTAFDVRDVSGPAKGQTLCYVWANGSRPVVVAFINDDVAKSTGLVGQIQKLTEQHADKELRAFVVYEGGAELKPAIEQAAQEKHLTIPVTFLPDGKSSSSLKQYRINPEARNTIMTYRNKTVTATFVNVDDSGFAKVAEATESMLK